MRKGEKIFDTIVAWIFLLGVGSFCIWGLFELSTHFGAPPKKTIAPKSVSVKKMPDSLHFSCVHCGWDNTRSLFDFIDTTKIDSVKSDLSKTFHNGMH